MRRRVALVLLALTLAANAHGAAPDGADLWLPPDAPVQGACHALLVHSKSHPLQLEVTISAANARIIDRAAEWVEEPTGYSATFARPTRDDYHARHATVTLLTGQYGFFGLHADETCRATYTPDKPAAATASTDTALTTLNEGSIVPDCNPPDDHYYGHRERGKHVAITGTGELVIRTGGLIQIMGPIVLVTDGDGLTKRHETGVFARDNLITFGEYRWLTLQSSNLTLRLASRQTPIQSLYEHAEGDGFRIDGNGATFTNLATRGNLLGVLPANAGLPLAGGILLLAAAVTVTGTHLLHRHRRLHQPPDPEDPTLLAVHDPNEEWDAEECLARAETHIQHERFDRALPWIERARLLAPTSANAAATHAFLLGLLGHADDALALYEQASRLAPDHDGEHLLAAARLAHQHAKPAETVEELLQRALQRDPNLIRDFTPEDEFQDLSGRAQFEAILGDAWERVLGEMADEGT